MEGKDLKAISSLARISHSIFQEIGSSVKPGISTEKLAAIVLEKVLEADPGGIHVPFLHFNVNDQVYHNPPGNVCLCSGDILTIDMVLEKGGRYSDGAWTYGCGELSTEDRSLIETSWEIARQAVGEIRSGESVRQMQKTLHKYLEKTPFAILPEARGHGVGLKVHDEPEISFYCDDDDTGKWQDQWLFTVEPVIIYRGETVCRNAFNKYVTSGRTKTSYFEHMVYIQEGQARCLNIPEIKMLDSIDIFQGFI